MSDTAQQVVRGVDVAVWTSARVFALEQGRTMGDVVTSALVLYIGGGSVGQKQGTQVSPRRQRGLKTNPRAKFLEPRQAKPQPKPEQPAEQEERRGPISRIERATDKVLKTSQPALTRQDVTACSHGLLFHPGCTDGKA